MSIGFMKKIVGMIIGSAGVFLFGLTGWSFVAERGKLNLKGKIDECCSEYGIVKELNERLNPVLMDLMVNLDLECPLYALQHVCKDANTCGICYCDDKDVPDKWIREDARLANERGKVVGGNLDYAFDQMGGMISSRRTPKEDWVVGENEEKDGVYVDLVKNVEAYTGYQGQNIWNMIYKENCFQDGQCLEERLLYKVLSGMHASVSSHLSEYYFDFKKSPKQSYPNVGMYFTKVGNHEDRIKNLYFAYTIMLRSFKLISEDLKGFDITTKNLIEDTKTKKILQNATNIINSYSDVIFDETAVFKGRMKENLKYQLKEYFYNISRLMNCVECEKCKVYGKMQIKGLGTALKILFDDQFNTINAVKRNELIAYMNTLTKWSTSLIIAERMFERRAKNQNQYFVFGGLVFVVMVIFSYILVVSQSSSANKLASKLQNAGRVKTQ